MPYRLNRPRGQCSEKRCPTKSSYLTCGTVTFRNWSCLKSSVAFTISTFFIVSFGKKVLFVVERLTCFCLGNIWIEQQSWDIYSSIIIYCWGLRHLMMYIWVEEQSFVNLSGQWFFSVLWGFLPWKKKLFFLPSKSDRFISQLVQITGARKGQEKGKKLNFLSNLCLDHYFICS